MAIGVTRAALRLAPGAVNRSGERGVRGFRSSLTQQREEGDPEGGKHQAQFYRLRPQRREVRPDTSALLDGENLDLMVAHQDDIAGGSADWSPRARQADRNPRAECPQITLFEASFGFQCSAHSSDGEFPLELENAGLLQL